MSQSQKTLDFNGRRRMPAPRTTGRMPPARHRPDSSNEALFGRKPFTYGRMLRYFGTGVPGYQSGPGFTGGYYGYGDESPEIPTELEREYADELDGDGPGWQPNPALRRLAPAMKSMSSAFSGMRRLPREQRRYPPGPKGYRRTDERIREEICDELMRTEHLDSSEVTVEVTAAKVTLDGTVPQRWMRHAIEDLADACPGVQDVDNRIRIKPTARGA